MYWAVMRRMGRSDGSFLTGHMWLIRVGPHRAPDTLKMNAAPPELFHIISVLNGGAERQNTWETEDRWETQIYIWIWTNVAGRRKSEVLTWMSRSRSLTPYQLKREAARVADPDLWPICGSSTKWTCPAQILITHHHHSLEPWGDAANSITFINTGKKTKSLSSNTQYLQ